jgi:hypothetical protein
LPDAFGQVLRARGAGGEQKQEHEKRFLHWFSPVWLSRPYSITVTAGMARRKQGEEKKEEERFLSSRGDAFAGAKAKEKIAPLRSK